MYYPMIYLPGHFPKLQLVVSSYGPSQFTGCASIELEQQVWQFLVLFLVPFPQDVEQMVQSDQTPQ